MTRRWTPLFLIPFSLAAAANEPEVRDVYGVGFKRAPVFDGADRIDTSAVPILDVQRRHLFVRTTEGFPELGAFIAPMPRVKLGAALSLMDGRSLSEARLPVAGPLADLDRVAALGPLVEARFDIGPVPMTITGRWRQALSNDRGAQADARWSFGIYGGPRLRVQGFGELTWASAASLRSEYGITPVQAAASGLRVHEPGAGIRHGSVGLRARWTFTPQWSMVTSLESRRLARAVTDSPLVTQPRASDVTVGWLYQFR